MNAAVEAAASAASDRRRRKPIERGRLLMKIAAVVEQHAEELPALAPTRPANRIGTYLWNWPERPGTFEIYGGLVNALHGETIGLEPDHYCFTRREPFGVVGVITPWNAPLNQAARAAAPALAAGNVVVVKLSECTSATTVTLARLTTEVRLPDGVLNVVTGSEAGAALVEHPLVCKVAFTGSFRAGKEVSKVAAERTIQTLELGGKSANILFADADMDRAIAGSVNAFVFNCGQVCSAGTRLLVQRQVHDEVVEGLVEAIQAFNVADRLGPVTTPAQYDKVLQYFDIAAPEGRER